MKKKTDRISDALGRLPLDLIKESAEYDAAAVRSRRLRVSVIVAAALLVAVAIPFGILLSRGGSGTDPIGTGEVSTANFLSADTTVSGPETTVAGPGTSETLPPDVTTDVPDTGTEPVAPAVIEDPTGPSFGGGMTTLSAEIPAELTSLTMSAEGGDSKIVPVDSSFIVRTAQPTTAAVIASNLSVSPATPLSITKLSDTEYRLTPASGDLTPGKIYRFTLGDPDEPAATFSFQTEKALAVSGMLPADGSGIVPLNTGIEVSFTEAIDPDDAADAFSLSPAVKGRYMLYPDGRTVAFIPEEPLSYGTPYTVTVREGIRSVSGKTLAEEKTAKFMTITREEEKLDAEYDEPKGFFYYFIDATSNSDVGGGLYSPGSAVTIKFNINAFASAGSRIEYDAVCDLYACPSAAAAAAFRLEADQDRFETDPGTFMSSFAFIGSYSCIPNDEYSSRFTVDLGSALPRGIYVGLIRVKSTLSDGSELADYTFVMFQITDLRAWTVSDESNTYFWLNRAYTGPEAGAKITAVVMKDGELSTSSSSLTGEDGLARIDNPSGIYTRILIAESGEDCLLIQPERSETPDETQGYYGAVYTDREKYFSTDTVSFSGFIAASDGGPLPGKLFVTTGYSALDTAVEVDETGFFAGSISFEDFGSGYIWLRFTDEDGRLIFNKAVFTTEEPKPRISASIGFDRSYYEKGDRVNAVLKAGFFDGTPVEGIEFIYYLSPFGISGSGRTDERGEIHISFAAEKVSASSTDAVTITVTAILTGTELQELTVSASVPYYHSDYLFKSSMTDEGMLIGLNLRDLSALETVEGLSKAEIDALTAGAPVDGKQVQYTVMINRVKRTKETRYDTYGKVTYSGWKYEVVRSVEKTGTAEFSGGRILLTRVSTTDPDVWFTVTVTFSDNTSPSSGAHDFNQYEVSADCTVRTGNSGKQPVGDSSFSSSKGTLYPEIVLNGRSFVCGDTVSAEIFFAGEKINALIFVISSKIEFAACSDGITFEFTPEMCQGGSVRAICYNAESNSFGWTERGFGFNYGSNLLEPEIETDKTEYRPGETSTVEISVPGLGEGTVIVSIVDEACFALKDQQIDPLSYRSMLSNSARVRITQQSAPYITFISKNSYLSKRWMSYKFPPGMGEGDMPPYTGDWSPAGSPDTPYVRKDFLDNPVFATLKTDAEGRATLSFTVPDNITSWRITVIAVGTGGGINELKTGSAVSNTVCTLPFFIDPDCCQKYVEGDTVTAGLRAYGKAAEGEVTYRGYLVGESGETSGMIETVADCGEKTWLRFEGVKEGRYKLTVYAYCGRYSDACEYELDVVKTAAAADVTKILTAEELKDLKPAYYPVRLTVSEDTGELLLFEQIRNYLSAARGSSRTDEYAARLAALSASDLFYGGNTADRRELLIEEILKRYNFGDAAFRLLPYSEGDSALTAGLMQLGIITDGSILTSLIERSYASIASSVQLSPEELCRTLAILASAGEPVMDILQRVESGSEGFSDEAKLWLALGFCSAGDHDGARRIYSAVRKASATENAEYRTLGFGSGSVTERVRVSSVALLCASVTDREDAAMIARWLLENRTDTESPQIALAAFLLRCRPAEGQKGIEFEYSLGEEKAKIRLDPGQSWTFVLCREDLERLELSLPENALLLANYRGELEESASSGSGRFTIEKTYEATGEGFCLVTLTLSGKSTRTYESFEIYDLIPSGARFFSEEIRDGNRLSDVSNTSGQNISCFVTVRYPHDEIEGIAQAQGDVVTDCPEYEFSVRIGYVIRAALQGDFIAESAWAENTDTGERAMSGRSLLTIGSGGVWSTSALPEAQ